MTRIAVPSLPPCLGLPFAVAGLEGPWRERPQGPKMARAAGVPGPCLSPPPTTVLRILMSAPVDLLRSAQVCLARLEPA